MIIMRVEISIAKEKAGKMPKGPMDALREEMTRRISKQYDDVEVIVKTASNDGLSVMRATDKEIAKEFVEETLKDTWETADDWFADIVRTDCRHEHHSYSARQHMHAVIGRNSSLAVIPTQILTENVPTSSSLFFCTFTADRAEWQRRPTSSLFSIIVEDLNSVSSFASYQEQTR